MKKRDLKDKSLWFFVLNDLDLIKKKILSLAGGSETDPIFTASPAFGITQANITKWGNALQDASAFATAAQGALADSATQPGDLATYAKKTDLFSKAYSDLTGKPTLGTASSENVAAFATAAQGALADSATQPGDLGNIATITVPTVDPAVANTVWFDGTNLVVSAGV